jgi:hypothetical protein
MFDPKEAAVPQRIPVGFRAEYRGQAPAGEFVDRETGEKVEFAPNLKFEFDLADGDVGQLAIRQSSLDKVSDFDVAKLKKGEEVHLEGVVVLADRGSSNDSYFRPLSCRKAAAAVKAAA